jgi:hypothetical protein
MLDSAHLDTAGVVGAPGCPGRLVVLGVAVFALRLFLGQDLSALFDQFVVADLSLLVLLLQFAVLLGVAS